MKYSEICRELLARTFSFPYAFVTDVRNWAFDRGILHSNRPNVPTICIGNLAIGGTGKTPHTAWVVKHCMTQCNNIAILSRGYGRATRGYYEVGLTSTATEVGDEPLQQKRHFSQDDSNNERVRVAVCENRLRGIEMIQSTAPHPDVVVLDDAFQHRYVQAHLNILLTEYSRLYCDDHVLPAGRLRERTKGARRADVIVVTKCPATLTTEDRRNIKRRLGTNDTQPVLFSTIDYSPLPLKAKARIVLVTGIAHSEQLYRELQRRGYEIVRHFNYRDHYHFTPADALHITVSAHEADAIVTTAKDAVRLEALQFDRTTREKIMVQDINVRFLDEADGILLDKLIKRTIESRNTSL